MKMHFDFNIAGISKSSSDGSKKIWEGAQGKFECEAEISEIVAILKDNQISTDKLLNFFKQDLSSVIRSCGNEMLELERKNRIMNNEFPRPEFKKILDEKRELEEKLEEKEMQLRSAMADCDGTNKGYQEEIEKNKLLDRDNRYLQKMNWHLKCKLRDWMSEISRDSYMDELATKVHNEMEKEEKKRQWSETIA